MKGTSIKKVLANLDKMAQELDGDFAERRMAESDERFALLKELKRRLVPSRVPRDVLGDFADWCEEKGVNIWEQDLQGENFKSFKAGRNMAFQQSVILADQLIHLFLKHRLVDSFMFAGHNNCLEHAIKTRKIPEKLDVNPTSISDRLYKKGWNKAVVKLKKNYAYLF